MHLQIIIFVQLLFLVKLKSDEDMTIYITSKYMIMNNKLLKKTLEIQVWLIISLLLSDFLYYNWYH